MSNIILSAQTQTAINYLIDQCIIQGINIDPLKSQLTLDQFVEYIKTTSRARIETEIATRSLSKSLVAFLYELHKVGGTAHYQVIRDKIKELYGMTVNDYASLRYFGLTTPSNLEDANGFWIITEAGKEFLAGKIQKPVHVVIHNNRVIESAKKMVTINDYPMLDWVSFHKKNKRQNNASIDNYKEVLDILLS